MRSALLSPGDYWVVVFGIADGGIRARHTVALNNSPVPEPESYVMLLAGLGVIVTVARRRLKS